VRYGAVPTSPRGGDEGSLRDRSFEEILRGGDLGDIGGVGWFVRMRGV